MARTRNLGNRAGNGTRTRNLGSRVVNGGRERNLAPGASVPTSSGGSHGVGGFFKNLGSDVVHTVAGMPAGVAKTGEAVGQDVWHNVRHPTSNYQYAHTKKIAHQIGESYAATYGPLTHGDVGAFLHTLYEHPLGPALDIATLATGGAGAVAKAGGALSKAGLIAEDSRLARLGRLEQATVKAPKGLEGAPVLKGRALSRNPVIRGRQKAFKAFIDRMPDTRVPHLGTTAHYARELRRLPTKTRLRLAAKATDYTRAFDKLGPEEQAALHLIGRGLHPTDYLAFLKNGGDVNPALREFAHIEPEMLKVLENPKIVQLFEHPTDKMRAAHTEAVKLTRLDAALKGIDPEFQADRIDRAMHTVYGTHPPGLRDLTPQEARARLDKLDATYEETVNRIGPLVNRYADRRAMQAEQLHRNRVSGRRVGGRFHAKQTLVAQEVRNQAEDHLLALADKHPNEQFAQDIAERARLQEALNEHALGSDAQLGQTVAPGHAPQHELARFYVPDRPALDRLPNAAAEPRGGGIAAPAKTAGMRRNEMTLVRTGRIMLHGDLVGREFLSTLKYGLHDDLHQQLMSVARRVAPEEMRTVGLPADWRFIRRNAGEKIHPLLQKSGETKRALQRLQPDEELPADLMVTTNPAQAETLHGHYLIVPSKLATEVAGEYMRSGRVVRTLLENPTKFWRAVILGYRPGFLTNNVIGNHVMLVAKLGGVRFAASYLRALRRTRGPLVRKLIGETPPDWREELIREVFPEQAQTFGRTQARDVFKSPRANRVARKLGQGIMPATQSLAETKLRKIALETVVRGTPEIKAAYKAMSEQTRDWGAAAKKAIEANPAVEREIGQKIDDTLGNYSSLSPFERGVLRNAIPFYAWLKVITTVSTKLALDNAARADILTKLGAIGDEANQQRLGPRPDWLLNVVPLGKPHGGTAPILATGGLNPYQSLQQVGSGVAGLAAGKPGEMAKALDTLGVNPFPVALGEAAFGKDAFTGRTLKGGPPGLLQVPYLVAKQLPPVQLVQAARGHGRVTKTYGKQSAVEAVLAQLGVPVKQLNLARAHQYARPKR